MVENTAFEGKRGLILGVANKRSIAWAIARRLASDGAQLAFTFQGERIEANVRELADSGLKEAVLEAARRKPLFGVCVGMQMLLDHSQEQDTPGLGVIGGRVLKFELQGRRQEDGSHFKVPQMGWNQVWQRRHDGAVHSLWGGVPDGMFFYFVHSYYAQPSDECHTAGETDYGGRFTCAMARDNIFATQFHPEKSAQHGLTLYRNFLTWMP